MRSLTLFILFPEHQAEFTVNVSDSIQQRVNLETSLSPHLRTITNTFPKRDENEPRSSGRHPVGEQEAGPSSMVKTELWDTLNELTRPSTSQIIGSSISQPLSLLTSSESDQSSHNASLILNTKDEEETRIFAEALPLTPAPLVANHLHLMMPPRSQVDPQFDIGVALESPLDRTAYANAVITNEENITSNSQGNSPSKLDEHKAFALQALIKHCPDGLKSDLLSTQYDHKKNYGVDLGYILQSFVKDIKPPLNAKGMLPLPPPPTKKTTKKKRLKQEVVSSDEF